MSPCPDQALGSIMTAHNDQTSETAGAGSSKFRLRRFVPLIVIVVASAVVFAMGWQRQLSFETLVRHYEALREFIAAHEVAAVAAYVVLYIGAVALSIPVGVYLTVTGGILFGAILGGVAAVVSATIGAICIFLIAKSAVGDYLVRRAGPLAQKLAQGFRDDAFSYLLFLRLVPIFPFWIVNLIPALVGVKLTVFAAATALGVIPATFVFAFVGAGLDSVIAAQQAAYQSCLAAGRPDCRLEFHINAALTPKLLGALVALGVLALIPIVVRRLRGRTPATARQRTDNA
jgi:uncharacterized membrane protein YdjX (TVP38/TMEM64 family)